MIYWLIKYVKGDCLWLHSYHLDLSWDSEKNLGLKGLSEPALDDDDEDVTGGSDVVIKLIISFCFHTYLKIQIEMIYLAADFCRMLGVSPTF